MTKLFLTVLSRFKCFSCGLLRCFYYGSIERYREGRILKSNSDSLRIWAETESEANAFDPTGWSWSKLWMDMHVNDRYNLSLGARDIDLWSCSNSSRRRRRLQSQDTSFIIQIGNFSIDFMPPNVTYDGCNDTVQQLIDDACQVARDEQAVCCNIVGSTLCDQLQENCEFDVCVAIEGDIDFIELEANLSISGAIELMCDLPSDERQENLDNLIPQPGFETFAPTSNPTTTAPTTSPSIAPTVARFI